MAKRDMQGAALHGSRQGNFASKRFARSLALALAAALFLALTGAMETIQWPLWRRLVYWVPLMLLTTPIAALSERVTAVIPPALKRFPVVEWMVVSAIVALPITLIVWAWTRWFNGWPLNPDILPNFYGPTFTVTLAMVGIGLLMERPGAVTHAAAAEHASPQAVPAPRARFLDRLPAKVMGGALYAVKAEDHYLRLYTSKGEDLILMRLSDALLELEGLEGAQTHRSWWVAKEAVQSVKRAEGKVSLVLPGGIEAPVSRANMKPLKDEGWI